MNNVKKDQFIVPDHALSIMAEIVMHRNGGTGRPLHQRAPAKGANQTATVPA